MAFQGYLLKINGVTFPNKFIAVETYQVTPNQVIDDDSYRDGDGVLHRSTLPHTPSKIEFNTPTIREADCIEISGYFPSTVSMTATIWNPKKHVYETGTFYTPDITYTIKFITANDIIYNPIRIALIEY